MLEKKQKHKVNKEPEVSDESMVSVVRGELEELISLLAQTSDSTIINLTTKFEKFESDMEKRDDRRWSLFKWFIGAIIMIITALVPIAYVSIDHMQTNMFDHAKRIATIESNASTHVTQHELANLVEKRFSQLEASVKYSVTTKDLEKLKADLYEVILKSRSRDGGSR